MNGNCISFWPTSVNELPFAYTPALECLSIESYVGDNTSYAVTIILIVVYIILTVV